MEKGGRLVCSRRWPRWKAQVPGGPSHLPLGWTELGWDSWEIPNSVWTLLSNRTWIPSEGRNLLLRALRLVRPHMLMPGLGSLV